VRRLPWLLISVTCLAASLVAQSWRVDSTKIGGAMQDSSGRVWAFGIHPNLGVYGWEGENWLPVGLAGIPNRIWPWALARGPEGAVYFLWSDAAGALAVSRHQGTDSKLLVRFAGRLRDRPRIFVDPGGDIWITEQGRHIFRVTPQGKAECVYTIADNQYLEAGRPKSENWAFNPVLATADGRGRVWFWSESLAGRADWASLAGVLVFDGVKFEHHPDIAGIPDKKLSVIELADTQHMWLAVVDDQLYRVDTNTLAATPAVREPGFTAFRNVQRILQTPREAYLVAGSSWQPVPERSGGGRFGTLWQGVGGTWKRLVNGLDMRPESFQQPSRPFLATDDGLWVGAFGSGPWFMPARSGADRVIDWRYGTPLDGSEGLFQLPDGRLLILAANQASFAVKAGDLLAAFQSPSGFSTLNPLRTLAQDVRGHLWGILAPGDGALSEWDGRRWIDHPLPRSFPLALSWDPTLDSLGRIWLLFRSAGGRGDPTPVVAWNDPENFAAGSTTEGVDTFGTGFGTSPVVGFSKPGISCKQTYGSDTQITCVLAILPDVLGGSFDYVVTSRGYNGIPFDDGVGGAAAGIFDPVRRTFQTYAAYDQALEAQLPLRSNFHLPARFFKAPTFSSDGKTAYRETGSRLRCFEGGHWREWTTQDITGQPNLEFGEAPFFDRAGNLAVRLHGQTWEFTNQEGWRLAGAESNPSTGQEPPAPRFRPVPPGCNAKNVDSQAQDRLGTLWFTSQGQLYRAIGGRCVAQCGPNEHQPFIDARKLQAVLTDPAGNAFLLTQAGSYLNEYVILRAQPPLPRCALRGSLEASGNVVLRFSAKSSNVAGFTWRVDGGPWSTPAKAPETTIEELPNGRHHFEAAAVDNRLQMDLTPASTVVDIRIDQDAHIRELIRNLANRDYAIREKAVAALVRWGPLSLPLLRSAREKATLDERWWIDAAIQRVEQEISTHKEP
jgi:streptogramin lyase